jgi:hypothetical protein
VSHRASNYFAEISGEHMARKPKSETDRPIEFYRIVQKAQSGPKIDIKTIGDALKRIEKLDSNHCIIKANTETLRFHTTQGDNHVGLVLTITRNKLPPGAVSSKGLSAITLQEGQEIGEYSHLVFFKPHYIGVCLHQHSPTMNNFSELLSNRLPELGEIEFQPCVNPNFFDRLNKLDEIRGIRMSVTPSVLTQLEEVDGDHAECYRQMLNNTGFRNFYVYMTVGKGDATGASGWADKFIRKILKRNDSKKDFEALKIKLYDLSPI